LRLLDILLVDSLISIDAHMDELNLNPNTQLTPYCDTRLYLRAVTYGAGAVSLFESWASEQFLLGMKDLYKPVSITSRSRPEFLHTFSKMCLRLRRAKSPPPKKTKLPWDWQSFQKGANVTLFWSFYFFRVDMTCYGKSHDFHLL